MGQCDDRWLSAFFGANPLNLTRWKKLSRSYLLAASAIAEFVGNRITWATRPQASAFPAIVLQVIDGVPVYADEGETGLTATRVQADCWGRDYVSLPKIPSGVDSHRKAESSHPDQDVCDPACARNVHCRPVQVAQST